MKNEILKDYDKELNLLLIFNIILFIIIGFGFEFVSNNTNIIKILLMLIMPSLPSLLITDFIPSSFKEIILYPKYSTPILTLLEKEDKKDKIEFKLIKLEYDNYNEDFRQQKKIWYDIYRKHEHDPRIRQINRQYLLTRDLVVLTIISAAILLFFTLISCSPHPNIIWWFILIFMETCLFIIMTNRFYDSLSRTVLLEESYHLRNKYKDKYCFTYA